MKMLKIGGLLVLAAFVCSQSFAAEPTLATACVLVPGGVEYRSFLPDQKRYVYVAVKVLTGVYPSVFVIVDKNYDEKTPVPVNSDPLAQWWLDRSKPMTFSTDNVKIRWPDTSGFSAITSWVSTPDTAETTQTFRGLQKQGTVFLGTGTRDTNSFAFQTRVELSNLSGDEFDVVLPSVSAEGVSVTPPVAHFVRDGTAITTKC